MPTSLMSMEEEGRDGEEYDNFPEGIATEK